MTVEDTGRHPAAAADTGQHALIPPPSARATSPLSPLWKSLIASVLAALVIGGLTGLVTWGNTSAQIEHQRATVEGLKARARANKAATDRAVRELELEQARTTVTIGVIKEALDEVNGSLESIEDKLDEEIDRRRSRRRNR